MADKNNVLTEDGVPVNTTQNAGQPLGNDRPIKSIGVFRRFQQLKAEKKKTLNKE